MRQPTFYPHPTSPSIDLIQTHISYVLLTGPFAYKIKKPVDFGFVNFSTLDRRRHFCNEELRLNRRGAPGLYLDVLPLSADADGFHLDAPAAPIEYALKMRQFPPDALLNHRLRSRQITDDHILSLARTVAAYHAAAPTNPAIASFGEPARIRQAIDDNHRHTARFAHGPATAEQLDQIRAYTDHFFDHQSALLSDRVAAGFIRECHGDLHLANICLFEGNILLFDCIEFNESFRFVDVMYDVAFAAMDLEAHGRPDLAALFVNEYAERTGDWPGLQVLPLYLCRQAHVRAKVHSLLLEDPAISPESRQAATETAANYYRLAARYAQPRRGKLVLMSGPSGAGKSTIARELARRTGAIHIRSDALRKHLAALPLDQRGTPDLYTDAMTQETYARLLVLGLQLSAQGHAVILDARYHRQSLRAAAIDRAAAAHLPLQILHCDAPDALLLSRLNARTADVSDATPGLLAQQRADTDPFSPAERPYVQTLDASQPAPLLIDRLLHL